jgi:hypothetical protein
VEGTNRTWLGSREGASFCAPSGWLLEAAQALEGFLEPLMRFSQRGDLRQSGWSAAESVLSSPNDKKPQSDRFLSM